MNAKTHKNFTSSYRYHYNSMEMDAEVSGSGNSYTTEFRQYDPRLGRWKSLDPLMAQFPWMSPYMAFNNNPVFFIDPLGLEGGPAKEKIKIPDVSTGDNSKPGGPGNNGWDGVPLPGPEQNKKNNDHFFDNKMYSVGGPFPLPSYTFANYKTFAHNIDGQNAVNYTSKEYLDFKDKEGNFQVKYDEPSSMQVLATETKIYENGNMTEFSVRMFHYKLKFFDENTGELFPFKFRGGINELSVNGTNYFEWIKHTYLYYGGGIGVMLTRPAVFDEYPGVKTENVFNDNAPFYQIHGLGANAHGGIYFSMPIGKPTSNGFLTTAYLHLGAQAHGFVTTKFKTSSSSTTYLNQNISVAGGGLLVGGGFKFSF